MARGQQFDFLHNMRFHVTTTATTGTPGDLTTRSQVQTPEAGFSACTVPEATVEVVEYKEGQFLYTRKFPGHVTYGDCTLSRGVAKVDSGFWLWIQAVIEGGAEYRQDVSILHYHRVDTLPGPTSPPSELLSLAKPSRMYKLYNAFPGRHKFASDLDGTDSAVSIMELDLAYEHCSLLNDAGDVVKP